MRKQEVTTRKSEAAAAGLPVYAEAKLRFDREYVVAVLQAVGGNISRAAKLAGKDRADFYKLMRRARVVVKHKVSGPPVLERRRADPEVLAPDWLEWQVGGE